MKLRGCAICRITGGMSRQKKQTNIMVVAKRAEIFFRLQEYSERIPMVMKIAGARYDFRLH